MRMCMRACVCVCVCVCVWRNSLGCGLSRQWAVGVALNLLSQCWNLLCFACRGEHTLPKRVDRPIDCDCVHCVTAALRKGA